VQLLLNVLGIGIGLSLISAASMAGNPGAGGFSMTAGLWWTLSGIIASLAGSWPGGFAVPRTETRRVGMG